jgi:hypothetical protein
MPSIGQELLNVPMGDMIRQMAFAIAEAQVKLDQSSCEVAEMMGGLTTIRDGDGNVTFDDSRVFFGHEYMSVDAAKAYMAVDYGLTGGTVDAALKQIVDAQGKGSAKGTDEIRVPTRVSMLELGFTPTFYQFIDTIIEVKIAIKITRSSEFTRRVSDSTENKSQTASNPGIISGLFARRRTSSSSNSVSTSQVDATYSSKYSYSAEGASLLRTKLTPLPPPPILEERIRLLMEDDKARRQAALDPKTPKVPAGGGS